MNKYVVISYNCNPDYIYYAPLTMWAWAKFGWSPFLIWVDNPGISEYNKLVFKYTQHPLREWKVNEIEGYRSATIAQISRLYAAISFQDDDFIMTGDCDLIPLSDYWRPDVDSKTVYGFDLTDYTEFPICFISMKAKYWREVMKLTTGDMDYNIKRDLDAMPNAKSDDFYSYWGVDQQLITQRLKPFNPTLINRGKYSNGYATGRMDRGNWDYNHTSFTDAHMFQQLYFKQNQDKFDKTMELLTSIWPDEDFGWWIKYTEEFRKLTGHS